MSNHNTLFNERCAKRMNRIDKLPAPLRELVHEYGLSIVTAFTDAGMYDHKRIRHCIETVLNELSPLRKPTSSQRGNQ